METTKQRIKKWTDIGLSVIWIIIGLFIAGLLFDFAVNFMSKPNTILFTLGFLMAAISVIMLFIIVETQISKIKWANRKIVETETNETKEEGNKEEEKK